MLEKSYLCGINNNPMEKWSHSILVVICLKSLTFVVSITTTPVAILKALSCDLLEKSYLCGINNNQSLIFRHGWHVVICLKSLTFVVSITTKQGKAMVSSSCDLLEKSYLCGINNNFFCHSSNIISVVICLKSLTFVVSITTNLQKCYFHT